MKGRRAGSRTAAAGVCLAVFLVDAIGVRLWAAQSPAAAMWPAAGVAVAVFVWFGNRVARTVFGAGLAAHLFGNLVFWKLGVAEAFALALAAAACQSGGAWAVAAWMRRFCGGDAAFRNGRNFVRLIAGAAVVLLVAAGIRAALEAPSMPGPSFGEACLLRGVGDFVGMLIFTSLVLTLRGRECPPLRWRMLEVTASLGLLALAAQAMNGPVPHFAGLGFPGVLLVVPVLFWIAFRSRTPGLPMALLVLAAVGFLGVVDGRTAFAGRTMNESVFDLISFLAMASVIGLGFVAVLEERDGQFAKLNRLNEDLEGRITERTRELEQINQELTDAVSIVAHDVRGPVSGIRTLARHMRWAGLDLSAAESGELLGEIERTSAEAVEMMGRLLDLQRANHRAVGLVPADIGRLVADLCRHYELAAQEKGISLLVIRPGREMLHLVDTDGIKFIVSNLVSNALKFLPSGGKAEVRISEGFSGCMLVVTDNGPGIVEHELSGLFNRFAKAANRPTAGESSSGLGLFIVRKLVLGMKGTLSVESSPGQGATFVVEWPAEAIRHPKAGS